MFEKFAEDVNKRYREKLADILSNRMSNHNMAFDLLGKLKAMDFNALPIWRKK